MCWSFLDKANGVATCIQSRQKKIPKGFLKYLKGHSHIERAILKRTGKKWLVKLNGRRLEDGWEKFAGELSLRLGDLVIFRHEGDMEFEVSIFDSSECEREDGAEENNRTPEETSNKFEFKDATGKPKPKITSQCKAFSDLEAAKDMLLGRPHFISTVKPYWMSMSMIHVPKLFARESELSGRKCGIMIRDEERSWPFSLFYRGRHTFIGGEWRKFCAANLLKEGDRILFEIFSNGEKPVLKIYGNHLKAVAGRRVKTPDVAALKLQVPASTSADANPHFISTIKSYSITNSALYLPTAFAKSTGLMSGGCEIILIDEKHRSWSMWLGRMDCHFGIRRGWDKFLKANGLQVGDPSLQV
ncbi:hypothetical protein BC332_20684 [Capsicum chinense]|nr:hypothetical protein BC332_20684 [Capsicum chinense]